MGIDWSDCKMTSIDRSSISFVLVFGTNGYELTIQKREKESVFFVFFFQVLILLVNEQ
jgi:hypothetical protein